MIDLSYYEKCTYKPKTHNFPINIIIDIETGDPDDYFAFCLIANNSKINLKAVTISPGTKKQVNLIKSVLKSIGKESVPVGCRKDNYEKECMTGFWNRLPYEINKWENDGLGCDVIYETIKKYPDCVIVTCGPNHNLYEAIKKYPDLKIDLWFAQGGFAGDNVVLEENRMSKFNGKVYCQTFNFNGNTKGAEYLLKSDRIKMKVCVSKNVCHSIVYDKKLHKKVALKIKQSHSSLLKMIYQGMSVYFEKRNSKKFHDPLAVLCLINPNICTFKRVIMKRDHKLGWRSDLNHESNVAISVSVDHSLFEITLLEQK